MAAVAVAAMAAVDNEDGVPVGGMFNGDGSI